MGSWELSTYIYIGLALFSNIIITAITLFGGYFDVVYLFKTLRREKVDETDDGRVVSKH